MLGSPLPLFVSVRFLMTPILPPPDDSSGFYFLSNCSDDSSGFVINYNILCLLTFFITLAIQIREVTLVSLSRDYYIQKTHFVSLPRF